MSSDAFILKGTIDVDVNDAVKGLKEVDSSVEKSSSSFEKIGSKLGGLTKLIGGVFATKAVVDFGKKCLSSASDVQEMQNKFDVVFDKTGESMNKWAEDYANAIGRSSFDIKTAISNQSDLMMGMGMSEEQAGSLSKKFTELAYDLGSFNNVQDTTALEAMTKAMYGETEMAKQLGINLSATVMENSDYVKSLGKSWSALTQAEKAEAYYQEALKQSPNALGDATRSVNSYESQMRKAKAKIEEFCQTIGSFLLPAGTSVVSIFAQMVDKAIGFINGISEKWQTVGAPIVESIKSYFSGMGITTDTVMTAIKSVFQGAVEYIKVYWETIGQPVFNLIMQVIGWVKDAFAEHMPQIQAFFSGFVQDAKSIWENNLKPCFEAIGNFISNVLAPVFKYVFNSSIVPTIERAFMFIAGLWNNSLKPIFKGIIDFITGVFSGDWGKAWNGIVQTLSGIFGGIIEVVKVPINAVIGLINSAIDGINSISVNIPDWVPAVGGKTFGVNLPSINYLENGGILTQPTMLNANTMAGEKNRGRQAQAEAVIPLDKLYKMIDGLTKREIVLQAPGGKEIARYIAPYQGEFDSYTRRQAKFAY